MADGSVSVQQGSSSARRDVVGPLSSIMMPVLAQLELALPSRLLLLVLLPAIVWLALVGRKEQSLAQRLTSAALRSLVVALLCFAWAAPSWHGTSERRFVVFVRDQSLSCMGPMDKARGAATMQGQAFVNDALAHRGNNSAYQLPFASTNYGLESNFDDLIHCIEPNSTDIASAVVMAQAVCPNDYVPQIVLLSDGLETRGNVIAAAMAAKIPISCVPLPSFVKPKVEVDRIDAPLHAARGEAFDVSVTLRANYTGPVDVELRADKVGTVAAQRIDVSVGETIWRTTATLGERDSLALSAYVDSGNRGLTAVVLAREPAKVLVVDSQPNIAAPLVESLNRLGYDAQAITPAELPTADTPWKEVSLIVLREVAASALGPARQAALDRYVRGGGGLLVVGGEAALGEEVFRLTGLEKMLPVTATEQPEEQERSLALVLVVDKSLSMKDENRFELAKAAARRVVDVLSDTDQVGVVAFGDDSQWVSRLAPLTDKRDVLEQIDKLEASGLTNMYPAITRAYLALSQADADSRYAILLTDGVPTPGDFGEIARKMADAGITVSTVSISQGADQTILKDIARIARGNHHHVNNPAELPQILERETRSAVSQVAASETTATALRKFPGLDVAGAPTISGFVTTRFKPGAQVLLVAGEGDPLVAWWRYGRGVSLVVTADVIGASGNRWRAWSGHDAFWRTLTKHALRDDGPGRSTINVREEGEAIIVTLDAQEPTASGPTFINGATATLSISPVGAGAAAEEIDMHQVAPGRYSATLAAPRSAVVLHATLTRDGQTIFEARRGFAARYAEEYRLRPTDEAKLKTIAEVTGGTYNPSPESVFAPDGRQVDVLHPLFTYFLIAALVVYLADIALRRIPAAKANVDQQPLKQAA